MLLTLNTSFVIYLNLVHYCPLAIRLIMGSCVRSRTTSSCQKPVCKFRPNGLIMSPGLVRLLLSVLSPRFCLQIAAACRRLSGLFSLACAALLGPAMAGGAEQPSSFPTTLAGFGYDFNGRGEMRKIDSDTGETTDEPFQFEVRPGDREYNQRHYEAIGEVVTEEVYRLLETAGRLDRLQLLDSDGSFVFVSSDWRSCERLVVLIHGSGVVRAGQWARRLVMNEDLEKGTQLPYIQRAREEGYGVIVMNTNQNTVVRGGGEVEIPGSETPLDHGVTVWERLVKKSKAKDIVIVAHRYYRVSQKKLWKQDDIV